MSESKNKKSQDLDYEKIIATPEFKSLVKKKSSFSRPYIIFFFVAFFTLPILTSYTNVLENDAIGHLTWTWVYSFGIFAMVWILTSIYMGKAKEFDKDVEAIIKTHVIK